METRRRSIAKALSYRFFGMIVTCLVAWCIIGDIEIAVGIGFLDTLVKIAAYYGHERVWLRIPYGKPEPPEFQI